MARVHAPSETLHVVRRDQLPGFSEVFSFGEGLQASVGADESALAQLSEVLAQSGHTLSLADLALIAAGDGTPMPAELLVGVIAERYPVSDAAVADLAARGADDRAAIGEYLAAQ